MDPREKLKLRAYPWCGGGVCSQTDYGISGDHYVRANTPACNSDCPQTCGNGRDTLVAYVRRG